MKTLKTCCGTSVGIVIQDTAGRYLMITRSWWPIGVAPVAGHGLDGPRVEADGGLDIEATLVDAAHREVTEEVGLTVTELAEAYRGHRFNLCSKLPHDPPGHDWRIFRAHATGTVRPSMEETRGAAWYTAAEVEDLARRTIAHGYGKIARAEFEHEPGLEPVWVDFFHQLGIITVADDERAAVRDLAAEQPPTYWADSPPVVVLCGSTRFSHAFREANLQETLAGRIVLSIGCDMRRDGEIFSDKSPAELDQIKTDLDELHKRKIDLADEVLILNVATDEYPNGYIGESTAAELGYARSLGKPIRFLREPGTQIETS